jgi:GH15 family glucan-1,4-alpha-glucosidase
VSQTAEFAARVERPLASSAATAPAIKDYAIIGDCRTAALVSRAGSIDWLCLPDFSSASVFARLLDPGGGSFCIQPRGPFTAQRRYIPSTPVVETTFTTGSGVVRVLDFCPMLDGARRIEPMREILRVIDGRAGSIDVHVRLDPRPDYACAKVKPRRRGRLGWSYAWGNQIIVVGSDVELHPAGDALATVAPIRAGERVCLSLSYAMADPAVIPLHGAHADAKLAQTIAWWQGWAAGSRYGGPYREPVVRSAITLKLLNYVLSGAIVAAPTTSLPESWGDGRRNWDYRYCWLRDAGVTNQALVGLGYIDDARSFLDWLLHATRLTRPELQIMYDVFGRTQLDERELPQFAGYCGSRPVRIGNAAHTQRQLDIYGEVVMAADAVVAGGRSLDAMEARMLAGFGDVICRQWREPDSSIWEIRGPPRQYTFSKVMCWAALDRLLKLQACGAVSLRSAEVERFTQTREAIAGAIERRGYNPAIASYVSELDGSQVDASLLLMARVGYKHPGDPRMRSTYDLLQRRLARNGLLHRYEPGYDGFDSEEGAFGICSFWSIDNLAQRGDLAAAERSIEHLLSFANDLGLYAEEVDTQSGAALGNFPQAFTHVGLINAALAIEGARARR